ncbi:hypothetical protein BDZ91DRAFT_768780 [Neofusicoccum parvum]|uniref:Uncharacterized protein n=1 Tax=Neofusicoccum parvum TaxID=310453 RepID=A0ACB5S8U3_9PEZI|nr:hypothetical protein BDZ91DRAFT_768780 [Neofusicoccum parvum]
MVASFDTDGAEFTGTLTQHDVTPPKTRPWQGFFLTHRDTPLTVIQNGRKPLPPDVKAFIDVSPLASSGENEVQSWADSLFLDLMIHGLPQKPIGLLFSGNVGEVGSRFAAEKIHDTLPSVLQTAAGNYLNPKQILADNQQLFYFGGLHVLVKSLRSSDNWFDKEFRDECQDKVEPFFNMVACPTDASADTVNGLKNAYGSGLKAAQELDTLRPQYRDAVKRCYDTAYTCLRPILAETLSKPDFLNDILSILRSPQYIEHWLPTLVQLSSTPESIPIVGQLAMLFDKLEFLAVTEAKSNGQSINLQPVHDVISLLTTAAQQTGLVRNSMINPTPEKIELKLDNVITEENMRIQSSELVPHRISY